LPLLKFQPSYVRIEGVCRLTPSLKHYNRPAHLSRSFDSHET